MKQYIVIEADTNDADYVMQKTAITSEELELIMPVITAIADFRPYQGKSKRGGSDWVHRHNFPIGEVVREDLGELSAEDYYVGKGLVTPEQFEMFYELVPYSEYGIHTVKSIELITVAKEETLL
jgi:hypothetical protein